jgi:phosphoribosyl 1,2-cyclic phosphate phosphodiesterase
LYKFPLMKITFLGTGTSQGVPVIACKCAVCNSPDKKDKRLRSSVFIETGINKLVIDAGPDFRQQMLRNNVKEIDAVLITHGHKDHVGGLDDVRAFNYFQGGPVNVYAEKKALKILKSDFFYAFEDEKYPGVPDIKLHEISNQEFKINKEAILPVRVLHYKLAVLGFRINDFSYITDANFISEKEIKKIKGTEVLVLNALRRKEHISHFTLKEALEMIKIIRPKIAYLTHISHQMGLHREVENELPCNVHLAFDGMTIEI